MTAVEKLTNASSVNNYQTTASAAATAEVEAVTSAEKVKEVVTEVSDRNLSGSSAEDQTNQLQSKGDSKTANEEIKKKVDQINKEMLDQNSEAIFGIHEETNRVTIKIVDKDSKRVIKEFPPEKTLDMLAKLWEVAGIMVDEKR